ncbi:MAG: hypothetical protein FWG90_03505 [Oscillospiraceae bacterium]|nr:hypothetical protein [Oscillospiraceae bacterium]
MEYEKGAIQSAAAVLAGFISWSFCFALSLVLVACLLLAAGSYAGGKLLDERGIEQMVESVDLLSLKAADLPDFIPGAKSLELPPEATILDGIYSASSASGLELTRDEIRDALESSELNGLLTERLAGLAAYLVTGAPPEIPEPDELKQVFIESLDVIGAVAGIDLSEAEINMVLDEISQVEQTLSVISDMTTPESGGILPPFLKSFISPVFTAIFSLCALASAVLIFIARADFSSGLKWCGASFLAAGLAVSSATLALSSGWFSDVNGIFRVLTQGVSVVVADDLYFIGTALCAVGLVFLLLPLIKKIVKQP